MATRGSGTFLISWAQSELDGLVATDPGAIAVGSTWRWSGQAICVDNPRDILVLENSDGIADLHARAASKVRRFLGDPDLLISQNDGATAPPPLFKYGFEITDGHKKYQATLIFVENGQYPMALFVGALPPVDHDLWVVSCTMPGVVAQGSQTKTGTVCFVPDTRITTPDGPKLVQDLREDDLICTKDNGHQAIRWIGSRQISGGRMVAMPHLRPVRIQAHVLADGEPDHDLLVSPDHRLLVKGPVAQALFNTHEVLVAARDLINDRSIRIDHRCRGVSYIHLMLDQHQIVWANGVEVESFHPAGMAGEDMNPGQRYQLLERFPDIRDNTLAYGDFVRRNLTRSEAALFAHGAF